MKIQYLKIGVIEIDIMEFQDYKNTKIVRDLSYSDLKEKLIFESDKSPIEYINEVGVKIIDNTTGQKIYDLEFEIIENNNKITIITTKIKNEEI